MTRDRSKDIEFLDMPWPVAILAALSACLVLGVCGARVVYKLYRIPSLSMQPALTPGDYVIVDKFAYGKTAPILHGDVIVFRPGAHPDRDFVARVVAVGGDRVQLIKGRVVLNGASTTERASSQRVIDNGWGDERHVDVARETAPGGATYEVFSAGETQGDDTQLYEVPQGAVFVLGDNRDNAADSRHEMGGYGFVEQRSVVGKVVQRMPRETIVPKVFDAMRPF